MSNVQLITDNGQLSVGWEIKSLNDLCENLDSKRIPITKSFRDLGDIPYYGASGIVDYIADYIFDEDLLLVSEDGANLLARTYPIAFSITGKTWVNNHAHVLRFNQIITQRFVEYYLNSISLQPYVSGMAQPKLNQKALNSIPIPMPPIAEQKRIVAILDEAFEGCDRAIRNTEKNLANARELFESYLNAIFTKKGDGWENKKLEDICSIKHGFAFKGEFFTNEPSDYILLTPGSFYESGGYREQGGKTKYYVGEIPYSYILKKGDFLFAMTEQAVGLLGSSLIVPESDRFLHNQRLGLMQVFDGFEYYNDFFFYQFNTQRFRDAVQSTASGVKVRHTSPKKLGAITVFFPPTIAAQKVIADTLNDLYSEIQNLETIYRQKLAALKELKQSILQKAFTGELTADKEVA